VGTEDKRRQFDEIVNQLTADYPSLGRSVRRSWSRPVTVAVSVLGALVWGFLSIAMVAWGAGGVLLTCAVVLLTAIVLAVDSRRRRQ
jgi:Protein of unknown function (DUF3040)